MVVAPLDEASTSVEQQHQQRRATTDEADGAPLSRKNDDKPPKPSPPGTAARKAAKVTAGNVAQEVEAFGEDLVSDFEHIGDLLHTHKNQKLDIGDVTLEMIGRALFNSVMIYGITDIRLLIRQRPDEIQGDPLLIQKFLDLPINVVDLMKVVLANTSLLDEHITKSDIEMYSSAVKRYGDEVRKRAALELEHNNRERRGTIYQSLPPDDTATLEVLDDSNCARELVYAIAVDR